MSSEQKTIVINPELFNSSNKKKVKSGENNTTRKKEKKEKPLIPDSVPNSKTLRKQFIKKIKEKQAETEKQYKLIESQKEKEDQINKSEKTKLSFNDEFTKSLAYLTALSESRQKEKQHKKSQQKEEKKMNFTLKRERNNNITNTNINANYGTNTNLHEIQLELPESLKPNVLPDVNLNINNINSISSNNVQPSISNNSNRNIQNHNILVNNYNNLPISIIESPIIKQNNNPINNNNEILNVSPTIELKTPPPYGCLKGGNKPTYKQWTQHNRTLKLNNDYNDNIVNNNKQKLKIEDFKQNEELSEREKRLQLLKNKYNIKQKSSENDNENTKEKSNKKMKKHSYVRTIKKTTTVRNFKLGKNPKRKTISILIKNGATRKRVKTEIAELKRKGLSEIKEYLRARNLLKVGSDAPPDVLRQMYETSILTGEINNLSSETLVHNFLNS